MPQRKFANQKALIDYAEQNGLVYVWGWIERQRVISPAFTKRKRLLSPDQYEIVDVRTSRGVRTAMLFPRRSCKRISSALLREVLANSTRAMAGEAGGQAVNYRGKLTGGQRKGGCPEEHSRPKRSCRTTLGRPARSADWKALPSVSGCSLRIRAVRRLCFEDALCRGDARSSSAPLLLRATGSKSFSCG